MVAAAPFKGESFPAYVVSRTASHRPSATSSSCLALHVPPPTTASVQQHHHPHGPSIQNLGAKSASSPHAATLSCALAPPSRLLSPVAAASVKKATRPQRPSLSDQLKSISQGAQSITTQLRSSYQLVGAALNPLHQHSGSSGGPVWPSTGDCLLEATTIHLSVGRLDCRFPCPVQFAVDRCSYLFQHPFERKEIQMVMFYRDMRQLQLRLHERSLTFRVQRVLEQFGDDYRPANPHHFIKLVFATASEAQKVKHFLNKRGLLQADSEHDP